MFILKRHKINRNNNEWMQCGIVKCFSELLPLLLHLPSRYLDFTLSMLLHTFQNVTWNGTLWRRYENEFVWRNKGMHISNCDCSQCFDLTTVWWKTPWKSNVNTVIVNVKFGKSISTQNHVKYFQFYYFIHTI